MLFARKSSICVWTGSFDMSDCSSYYWKLIDLQELVCLKTEQEQLQV